MGIYKITFPKGHYYIGSATNLKKRTACHICQMENGKHFNKWVQRVFDKHGSSEIKLEIIEIVNDSALLVATEQKYIDAHIADKKCMNICPTAGSAIGRKVSRKTRDKIAQKAMGRIMSIETRAKMSDALRNRRGEKRPPETGKKIAEKAKGRIVSDDTKLKMSIAKKGVPKSEAHRIKLAEACRERAKKPISEETREKMSRSAKARFEKAANKGKDGKFTAFGAEHSVKWADPSLKAFDEYREAR
jgi:group I intron endonuclease